MTIEQLTAFFAWCTVINILILAVSSFFVVVLRDWATGIHTKMFDIAVEDIRRGYFEYLARYKILILFFNLTPYLALRIFV